MKFITDLGLTPDNRLVLVLAWKFNAQTQCEFTKDEFVNGMSELRLQFLFVVFAAVIVTRLEAVVLQAEKPLQFVD